MQSSDPQRAGAAGSSILERLLRRGLFEPLEPPTVKRDRPLSIDEEIVAEAEAGAIAL